VRHPEGLAADPATGWLYVGTFDARTPASARNNQLLRYAADGRLLAQRSFGETPLTGLAVAAGRLYVLNFGAGRLQRLALDFDAGTPIEEVARFATLSPAAPAPRRIDNPDGSQDTVAFGTAGVPAINGMVFDRAGNLYVSDSFQGAIYRIAQATHCAPCEVATLLRDPLLATAGALPFGANGLALNADESVLYINNAGDGRVLRLPLSGGPLAVLAEGLYGADGLQFHGGRLWVVANQIDTVVALDEHGRVRGRAGEFLGIAADGAPEGLLFPASTAVLGDWMFVTNLALPLTAQNGDEWEEQVQRWSLSRFRLPGH
jgi:sugar lactone lactonase YvrE